MPTDAPFQDCLKSIILRDAVTKGVAKFAHSLSYSTIYCPGLKPGAVDELITFFS